MALLIAAAALSGPIVTSDLSCACAVCSGIALPFANVSDQWTSQFGHNFIISGLVRDTGNCDCSCAHSPSPSLTLPFPSPSMGSIWVSCWVSVGFCVGLFLGLPPFSPLAFAAALLDTVLDLPISRKCLISDSLSLGYLDTTRSSPIHSHRSDFRATSFEVTRTSCCHLRSPHDRALITIPAFSWPIQ